MLTVKEVARQLNVSAGCVYGLVASGKMEHVRIGKGRGTIRISDADLKDFISRSRGRRQPTSRQTNRATRQFKYLDAESLQAAWREQDDHVCLPSGCNAPTSSS